MMSVVYILALRKTGHLNFEGRVLIGWLVQSIRYPANENAYLKDKHF